MAGDENGEPATQAHIRLEGVHKAIGGQQILRGVDLEVRGGETLVMIGGSGGGKTVILKHVIGLMRPDAGRVLIDGVDIAGLNDRELAEVRRKIGMLFQNGALFDSMSVGQNVAFPLRERGERSLGALTEKVEEALELVGLAGQINKMPIDLSGGMRKRVALARAMIQLPDSMLYDEPTAGLDPVATDAIDHLILRMQKRYGVTSMVVTHDMKSAYKIADRIAFLKEGAVYFIGTPDELRSCEDLTLQDFIEGRSRGAL